MTHATENDKAIAQAFIATWRADHDLPAGAAHLAVPSEDAPLADWLKALEEHRKFFGNRDNLVGDLTPDADALCIMYSQEPDGHPQFGQQDWRDEVARGETLLGYWERLEEYLYNKADDLVPSDSE